MTDVFGNYVIQKFFEFGTTDQKSQLVNKVLKTIFKYFNELKNIFSSVTVTRPTISTSNVWMSGDSEGFGVHPS